MPAPIISPDTRPDAIDVPAIASEAVTKIRGRFKSI